MSRVLDSNQRVLAHHDYKSSGVVHCPNTAVVEAVGVEPTKAEWQQIYSLPSLTAGAHLNFFCFLVETIGVEPISTDFQSVA